MQIKNNKKIYILTLKQRAQFLYHYINITARPIYGDTVDLVLIYKLLDNLIGYNK